MFKTIYIFTFTIVGLNRILNESLELDTIDEESLSLSSEIEAITQTLADNSVVIEDIETVVNNNNATVENATVANNVTEVDNIEGKDIIFELGILLMYIKMPCCNVRRLS